MGRDMKWIIESAFYNTGSHCKGCERKFIHMDTVFVNEKNGLEYDEECFYEHVLLQLIPGDKLKSSKEEFFIVISYELEGNSSCSHCGRRFLYQDQQFISEKDGNQYDSECVLLQKINGKYVEIID